MITSVTARLHCSPLSTCKLADLRPPLRQSGEAPFDVVVFSGVMYHMLDPLGGLAHAHSLVRDGGLLILETSAIIDHEAIFAANRENRFGVTPVWDEPPLKQVERALAGLGVLPNDPSCRLGAPL